MTPSRVRTKLALGETVLCAKASYSEPDIVELMGTFGFDGIWICLEHKRLDPSMVYALLRACRVSGMDPIVRIKPANYADLLWLLEAGARGIMMPRVRDLDEVRETIDAMKFPPRGHRGLDGVQAEARFGRVPAAEYVARANDGNFLVVQIEEPAAVPHIDAIAALPGVDVLFVGPGDLSLSLGKLGQSDDPEMLAIIQEVADACRRHGKTAGIPCSPEQVPKYHAMGYRFFNVVSDYRCVLNGLLQTQAAMTTAGHPLPVPSRPAANGTPLTLAGARPDPAGQSAATTVRAAY